MGFKTRTSDMRDPSLEPTTGVLRNHQSILFNVAADLATRRRALAEITRMATNDETASSVLQQWKERGLDLDEHLNIPSEFRGSSRIGGL